MAIEGVLTRQKCAEKWSVTLWALGLQCSVSPNNQIFNFHDFCKLEIQCTRNDPQNLPFCSGSPHSTFIIFFDISKLDFSN